MCSRARRVAFCVAVLGRATCMPRMSWSRRTARRWSVVHRDISPKNLLIGFDGLVRVADFGIAKARDDVEQTRVGVLKGNVGYMAAQYLRFQELDERRSDLFALGVVLHETLTRERLYDGDDSAAIAHRILDEPAPNFEERDVPPEAAALLFELMAKDRTLRPPNALARRRAWSRSPPSCRSRGPLRSAGFLDTELSSLRGERAGSSTPRRCWRQGEPASATPRPPRNPARAAILAGGAARAADATSVSTVGARRRWHRRIPLALVIGALVLIAIAWPRRRPRSRLVGSVRRRPCRPAGAAAHPELRAARRRLACWGNNSRGQLGGGTLDTHGAPLLASVSGVRDAAMGEVRLRRHQRRSRLVLGPQRRAGPPVADLSRVALEVPGLTGVQAIVAGRQHACALFAGGAVSCWGANESGQLARPPSTGPEAPAPVAGLPPVQRLFAGGSNTCAASATDACSAGAPTTAAASA